MKRECKLIIFLELWMLGTKKMKRLQVNFFFFVVFTFLRGRECNIRIFLLG